MGYKIKLGRKNKGGSLGPWRLVHLSFKEKRETQRHVPIKEWPAIGFSKSMSVQEAKEYARSINLTDHKSRWEKKRNEIRARLHQEEKVEHRLLPTSTVLRFEKEVLHARFGENLDKAKLLEHWRAARRVLIRVDQDPHYWHKKPELFYSYFKKQKYSLSYVQKLLRVLNLWGDFISEKTNSHFRSIPVPSRYWRQRIRDAQLDGGRKTHESAPLTVSDLRDAKQKLDEIQYRWLYLSLWLGLRPFEIDRLLNEPGDRTYKWDHDGEVEILMVYQPKLTMIDREKRWKPIPLVEPEQRLCRQIIQGKDFKRPLNKTLHNNIKAGLTCYGGRKGFQDLMLSRGYRIEDISIFMGHQDISRTWRTYKNKQRVSYKKVG